MKEPHLTHIDPQGNAHMVDVSAKDATARIAVAEGWIRMGPLALAAITEGRVKKGDVLQVAQLAGIMGAKRTSDLIPLCHPLPLDGVDVEVRAHESGIHVLARVRTVWRTGVEMEALVAVTTACLTIYDMVKALDRGIVIERVQLLEKRGGQSGNWVRESS
jgi:cyclic pyranopterin monophosphate synthase